MHEFKTINPTPIKQRPLTIGIGINDSEFFNTSLINGVVTISPFYRRWKGMLQRCYSEHFHMKYPTYKDCTVCKEWLTLSNFTEWMKTKDWEDLELDKDVRKPNNKIYSPETCCFVPKSINSLLNNNKSRSGKYKRGVTICKRTGHFIAKMRLYGNRTSKHIGTFKTEYEAHQSYVTAKAIHIMKMANGQPEEVKNGLILHINLLINDIIN